MKRTKLERCKYAFIARGANERLVDIYIELYGEPDGFYQLAKQIAKAEYSFLRREYGYGDIWAKDYAKQTFKTLENAIKRIYSDNE